jgi:hypothetical protein
MQGPQESEAQFLERINVRRRPVGADGKRRKAEKTKSFPWRIGIQLRSRGTVQSDRWQGRMSELVGDKLMAVVPVLGWWDQRRTMKQQEMRFSLIVSVVGPGVLRQHQATRRTSDRAGGRRLTDAGLGRSGPRASG